VVGVDVARSVAARIGLDAPGTEELAWAVRHHLLLADTATRRDLGDERTIIRFAAAVGTASRNALLYALTLGDSRATGPAAWNASKAALLRELFVKADARLRPGATDATVRPDGRAELAAIVGAPEADEYVDAMPAAYVRAFSGPELARHRDLVLAGGRGVHWVDQPDDRLRAIVVDRDRTGLLADAAAALALVGFDIDSAAAASHPNGTALEVFTGHDRFDRLATPDDRRQAGATIEAALGGELAIDEQLRARTARYRRGAGEPGDRDVRVSIDTEASADATVVEVHAPDDVGLLARVAAVFVDLDLDVDQAIVSTVGDRVVDVFYLHDTTGTRFAQRHAVESLRATLFSRLTAAVTLDEQRGPEG
jgi:[protein-PII] uridylyltransferase